jgi:hypothetical protein
MRGRHPEMIGFWLFTVGVNALPYVVAVLVGLLAGLISGIFSAGISGRSELLFLAIAVSSAAILNLFRARGIIAEEADLLVLMGISLIFVLVSAIAYGINFYIGIIPPSSVKYGSLLPWIAELIVVAISLGSIYSAYRAQKFLAEVSPHSSGVPRE